MKTPIWLRFAIREILGSRAFALTFVLNLSLGLLGFLVLDAFKESIANHLDIQSKSVLAADLRVSARRPLTDAELKDVQASLPPGSQTRFEVGMVSMGRTAKTARLIEIRAIDDQFPFYGSLSLAKAGDVLPDSSLSLTDQPKAWIYPELKAQLGVDIGDEISIGNQTFQIVDVITKDPSLSSVAFAVAPKVFIGLPYMEQTGLMQKGSRVTHAALYKLPAGTDVEEAAKQLKETFQNTSDLRIGTHQSASEQMARVLLYLNDYLGLVALVALFLAAVGAAYLFRSFLASRVKDIAILLSVGMKRRDVRLIYFTQLAILGLLATVLTLGLTGGLLPLLPHIFGDIWLDGLDVGLRPISMLMTAAVGIVSSILYCLPILSRLDSLNPSALFREDAQPTLALTRRATLGWIPAILFFWGLAVWQAQSVVTGSLFIALFLGAGVFLGLCGFGLLRFAKRLPRGRGLALRLSLLQLTRRELPTLACFMAVALGALLVNLIPQIKSVIERELITEDNNRPSLFLFDIQDEQVAPLQDLVAKQGTQLNYLSPLIRARYETLNGHKVSNTDAGEAITREAERASQMRNRSYNLSYRAELAPSETIVEGRSFSGDYDWTTNQPAEISVEARFAERVGLKLNDVMGFDVQGVAVEGKIVNLRRVKWTSFHPNFFVQFQPGVLNDAPKMFVAAVPRHDLAKQTSLQSAVVSAFPNISVVDVSQAIDRILELMDQIVRAVRFMAALTLLAGLAVLFSIARHQAKSRQRDLNMLKVLGTSFGRIRQTVSYEFFFIGSAAAILGTALSLLAAFVVARVVFESPYTPDVVTPAVSLLAIPAICILLGLVATSRQLNQPALEILKGPS